MNEQIQRDDAAIEQKEEFIEDPRETFILNLMTKKEEIERVIQDLKEKHKGYREYFSSNEVFEEMDRADAEITSQQCYRFLERKNSELKKIEALIDKVSKNEDFGWCDECGEKISQARLSVMPDATRCTACQSELERWESRMGISMRPYRIPSKKVDWGNEDSDDSEDLEKLTRDLDMTFTLDGLEEMDIDDNPSDQID